MYTNPLLSASRLTYAQSLLAWTKVWFTNVIMYAYVRGEGCRYWSVYSLLYIIVSSNSEYSGAEMPTIIYGDKPCYHVNRDRIFSDIKKNCEVDTRDVISVNNILYYKCSKNDCWTVLYVIFLHQCKYIDLLMFLCLINTSFVQWICYSIFVGVQKLEIHLVPPKLLEKNYFCVQRWGQRFMGPVRKTYHLFTDSLSVVQCT